MLATGQYAGAAEGAEEGEPFAEKMVRLTAVPDEQLVESARLDGVMRETMRVLDFAACPFSGVLESIAQVCNALWHDCVS